MEIFIVSVFDSDQQQALVKYMSFICATQYFSMADVSFDGFILLLLLPFFSYSELQYSYFLAAKDHENRLKNDASERIIGD